jgi:uncharacterized membrane protein YeaQ/YmgE (transglycosylase-associated protein family)
MHIPEDFGLGSDTTSILIFLGIGLVCGWLAGLVLGGGGLLRNLVAGVVGVFVGGYLFRLLHVDLPVGNALVSEIITGTVGAIVVIVLARIIAR